MQQLREAFGKLLVLYELSGSISYLKRLNRGHFQSEFVCSSNVTPHIEKVVHHSATCWKRLLVT